MHISTALAVDPLDQESQVCIRDSLWYSADLLEPNCQLEYVICTSVSRNGHFKLQLCLHVSVHSHDNVNAANKPCS